MSSPTQRSLALLRKTWPLVAVTERWNQFARIRQDLFGFCDALCVREDAILAVQTTSGSNLSARFEKMRSLPAVAFWLRCPSRRIQIHGWRKVVGKGKRKLWACRVADLRLSEMGEVTMKEEPK